MGTLGPALFALQQQMQQQPQAAQPTPDQTAIPANDPFAASTMQTMQQGRQAFATGEAQKADLANQLARIRAQQTGAEPMASGEYLRAPSEPKMQPMDSGRHVLGNIGRGLLLGLEATVPGRAVEAARYLPYHQKEAQLAEQSEELQKQLASIGQGQSAAGGMATRPYGALAKYDVGMKRAATEAERQKAQARIGDQRNQIAAAANDIKAKWLKGELDAKAAQTQMNEKVAHILAGSRTDVANIMGDTQEADTWQRTAEDEAKRESDHWLLDMTGLGPQKPVSPASANPPAKHSAKPNKPAGGVVKWGRDAQGNPVRLK